MRELTFSPERALESLLYLAINLKNATIHEVLKLRYFADKIHLQRYGSIASGDDYVAMKFGPVASNTYNMIKAARGERNGWIHPRFVEAVDGALSVPDGLHLKAMRGPNTNRLSAADLECLSEALRLYGNMPFDERTELSHDAAWKKAWDAAADESIKAGEMPIVEIASTLENAKEVLEFLHE
ncbi:hypothetical protein B2G74_22170 [Burkholderia sp. A27]|nr:hypothetical protein B2G74_22170 [Burkholderia sp. A27]